MMMELSFSGMNEQVMENILHCYCFDFVSIPTKKDSVEGKNYFPSIVHCSWLRPPVIKKINKRKSISLITCITSVYVEKNKKTE